MHTQQRTTIDVVDAGPNRIILSFLLPFGAPKPPRFTAKLNAADVAQAITRNLGLTRIPDEASTDGWVSLTANGGKPLVRGRVPVAVEVTLNEDDVKALFEALRRAGVPSDDRREAALVVGPRVGLSSRETQML